MRPSDDWGDLSYEECHQRYQVTEQDRQVIKPQKFSDNTPWWQKQDDIAEGRTRQTADEALTLELKQGKIVHDNATLCHEDRIRLHNRYDRDFVTPSFHGKGGVAADRVATHAQAQLFYMDRQLHRDGVTPVRKKLDTMTTTQDLVKEGSNNPLSPSMSTGLAKQKKRQPQRRKQQHPGVGEG